MNRDSNNSNIITIFPELERPLPKTASSTPSLSFITQGVKMNLYLLGTKIDSFYVVAEHPTAAEEKLQYMLEKANFGEKEDRKILDIHFVASSISYDGKDNPIFYMRDRLIL